MGWWGGGDILQPAAAGRGRRGSMVRECINQPSASVSQLINFRAGSGFCFCGVMYGVR